MEVQSEVGRATCLEPPLPPIASYLSLAPSAKEVTTQDKLAGMFAHL
jgi:hypothetical protein